MNARQRRIGWLGALGIAVQLGFAAQGMARDPLIRAVRPPLPPVSGTIEYEDLDGDGDPDVLRSVTAAGVPLQWIDDDDDMSATDRAGDSDSDCLMVDRNRDGAYGGVGDLMVDWNDEDGDGKADMQTIADNAWLTHTEWGPGHYMIVIDSDRDGVFNYIDWDTFKLECWEHSGLAHFFEDYLGKSLFLKMHTSTYNIRDLRYNWENPFLFYDEDDDGVTEKAIRLLDTPKVHPAPREKFTLPSDGSKVTDDERRIEFTRKIDWVSIAQDLDNDSVPGNEFDFDMTIHFQGPGFDYRDQVHQFASMRGLPEADGLFYDPRWRQITELVYPDHDSVWDLISQRGAWTRCWLVFDEDDDCHRWERVELYEPRDPFRIGKGQGGLDHHWQSDCSGDRGEWDQDASGRGKLYIGRFDGRIHLLGAEWAAWRIDQDAHFFQGWSRSGNQPERFPTIKYTDTDGNGFLDRIEYDLNGDRTFERAVSLPALGIDDRCAVVDPQSMKYADFQALHRTSAERLWARAEAAMAIAIANGVDIGPYAGMRHPGSVREQYHYGYWLNHFIHAELAELAEVRHDAMFLAQLDKAYFSGDWSLLTRSVAPPHAALPSVSFEVANPLTLARSGETVELPWATVKEQLPAASAENVRVIDDEIGREIVSQVFDADGDGVPEALLFQADLPAGATRAFTVQAAPRVSGLLDPSPVHAKFVPARMDDFAWESDRIAFRVYGPALRKETVSNGIDVWTKRVSYPIVEKWYQPGVDYHSDHGEGADLFKVGPTLGCGGTAIWKNKKLYRGENFATWRILANGPIRTSFELTYEPLEVDGFVVRESKRFSLDAGQNLTRIETVFDGEGASGTLEFAAGLVKRPKVTTRSGEGAPWIAMWGPIGGAGDGELGTGVVLPVNVFRRAVDLEDHYVAIGAFKIGEPVVHWTGAGWSRSGDFADAEAWNRYLQEFSQRVAVPPVVRVRGEGENGHVSDNNVRRVPIAKGWARNAVNAAVFRHHPVTTHDDTQYVAFYDEQGRMVLGKRRIGTTDWVLHTTRYEGNVRDAHNCISIAVDGNGVLHVAWDHHGQPMKYARSVKPGALELTEPMPMTGQDEQHVTYPEFYNLADGGLLCMYREGGSGRGNTMLNRYDPTTRQWSVVQHPLIDGQGMRNAYTNQLAIGPTGTWHVSWCWRESGDVASNHDVCYARSANQGRTWTRSDGTPYTMPITAATAEVAAPVPQGQELMNQCASAVDMQDRPLIATYWRPDGTKVPQYQLVWHDGKAWQTSQISQRRSPFSLSGGGTQRIPISRPKLAVDQRGRVYVLFRDEERGSRVSVAASDDPEYRNWRITDLTDSAIGMWEPGYDEVFWKKRGLMHIFAQRVGQGDGETLENVPPQMISILEWEPI